MRLIGRTLLWLGGSMLLVVALLVAINWRDEAPSADFKALLAVPETTVAPERNIYVGMQGIDTPLGPALIAAGLSQITQDEHAAKLMHESIAAGLDKSRDVQPARAPFSGEIDFCHSYPGSCWFVIAQHRADIDRLLAANHELYQRYLDLLTLDHYAEPQRVSALFPAAGPPGKLRHLFLASIGSRLLAARSAEERSRALGLLAKDLQLWLRMMDGEGSLLSKMRARACLQQDFGFLADLISDQEFDAESVAGDLKAMLALVKLDDWKLRGMAAAEFRSSDASWTDYVDLAQRQGKLFGRAAGWNDEQATWWQNALARPSVFFLKIQATRNLHAAWSVRLDRVAETQPAKLREALAEIDDWAEFPWWRYLYNPLGHMLISMQSGLYDEFFLRAFDTAAYQNLVQLALAARLAKVSDDQLPAFAERHPEWSRHPVSGVPMTWDPTARTLGVALQAKRKNMPLALHLWPQHGVVSSGD